jgi:hypothetical protein
VSQLDVGSLEASIIYLALLIGGLRRGGMSEKRKSGPPRHEATREELKAIEENLQATLDDALDRGVLTASLNAAISRLIAQLRARQQVAV